jgi:hypothetical protein
MLGTNVSEGICGGVKDPFPCQIAMSKMGLERLEEGARPGHPRHANAELPFDAVSDMFRSSDLAGTCGLFFFC